MSNAIFMVADIWPSKSNHCENDTQQPWLAISWSKLHIITKLFQQIFLHLHGTRRWVALVKQVDLFIEHSLQNPKGALQSRLSSQKISPKLHRWLKLHQWPKFAGDQKFTGDWKFTGDQKITSYQMFTGDESTTLGVRLATCVEKITTIAHLKSISRRILTTPCTDRVSDINSSSPDDSLT